MKFPLILWWLFAVAFASRNTIDVQLLKIVANNLNVDLSTEKSLTCKSILFNKATNTEELVLRADSSDEGLEDVELSVLLFRSKELLRLTFYAGQGIVQLFDFVNEENGLFQPAERLLKRFLLLIVNEYKILKTKQHHDFRLKVTEPGIYCAMVAAKAEESSDVNIRLYARNAQGSIDSKDVFKASAVSRLFIFGLVTLIIAAKKYTDLNEKKVARLPILLKALTYRVLAPFAVVLGLSSAALYVLSHTDPLSAKGAQLRIVDEALTYFFNVLRFWSQFCLLLFVSGHGIIHNYKGSVQGYTAISNSLKWPRRFLVADVVNKPILLFLQAGLSRMPKDSGTPAMLAGAAIVVLLVIMAGVQSLGTICQVWLPIKYYRATLKEMESYETKGAEHSENVRYTKSTFKKTSIIAIVLNLLRPFANLIVVVSTSGAGYDNLESLHGSYLAVIELIAELVQVYAIAVTLLYFWAAENCRTVFEKSTKVE